MSILSIYCKCSLTLIAGSCRQILCPRGSSTSLCRSAGVKMVFPRRRRVYSTHTPPPSPTSSAGHDTCRDQLAQRGPPPHSPYILYIVSLMSLHLSSCHTSSPYPAWSIPRTTHSEPAHKFEFTAPTGMGYIHRESRYRCSMQSSAQACRTFGATSCCSH